MNTKGLIFLLIIMFICVGDGPGRAASFKDALGRIVELESPPERIVSLAPSITEILYALGLGEQVVGVTQFSDYPQAALKKPKVGSYIKLNVERIIALRPDIVIGTADGNKPRIVKLLEQASIPVYIINPRKIRDILKTISTLGQVCGVRDKGKALSSELKEKVDRIYKQTSILKKPLVFLQINSKPLMTVNKMTFHHDIIRLAGGINLAGEETIIYPKISMEEILLKRPDIILISTMERGRRFAREREKWLLWTDIPAVKNNRIHAIDSNLMDRASPRIILGLEKMAKLLHPEVKWD